VPVGVQAVIERCLEKEPGRRYQTAGEVRAALEAIQAGTVSPWVAWRYHLTRKRWLAPAAALFGIVAVVVGFNVGGVRDRLVGSPPAAPPIKLAVLPFENLTGDPEQEYFSDGLTQEMITQLGRLHSQRLSVIARTSSMRYKNRDVPLEEIGRELGVDYLLEGSARREGSRVRISATLIQVRVEHSGGPITSTASSPAFWRCRATSLAASPGRWRSRWRPKNRRAWEALVPSTLRRTTRT
jgi:TolB-like protein